MTVAGFTKWISSVADQVPANLVAGLIATAIIYVVGDRILLMAGDRLEQAIELLPEHVRDDIGEGWRKTLEKKRGWLRPLLYAWDCFREAKDWQRAEKARIIELEACWNQEAASSAVSAVGLAGHAVDLREPWLPPLWHGPMGMRGLGWLLCATVVAPACYMVNSHGAAELQRYKSLRLAIVQVKKDIRDLDTAFEVRANAQHRQSWSKQLNLQAVTPAQYCPDFRCVQIKSADAPVIPTNKRGRRHVSRLPGGS